MKALLKRLIPLSVRQQIRATRNACAAQGARFVRGGLGLFGYNVSRTKDFYSPLPVLSDLQKHRARWDRPSAMRGIEIDPLAMQRELTELLDGWLAEFLTLPPYEENAQRGFGPGYTPIDAMISYMMLRRIKPRRYFEIGSGLSTWYAWQAGQVNAKEGHEMQITCVEPYPYPALSTIPGITLHQKEVQDLDPRVIEAIGPNEVLFIDSTHIVKIDSDVVYTMLELLPRLQHGVHVHIHDMPFPYNTPYPSDFWVFNKKKSWPMLWNEAMLVQAFLCFNRAFRVKLSLPYLRHHDEAFLRSKIPAYRGINEDPNTFSSLWLEKVE